MVDCRNVSLEQEWEACSVKKKRISYQLRNGNVLVETVVQINKIIINKV